MGDKSESESELERMAEAKQPGLAAELFAFLGENKKWWLIPILCVLGVFAVVAALASTPIAPFIYTLF